MNYRGILTRYLLREAGGAWLAVTVVLLAIMLSTRFARFLAQAAAGELPRELLFKVVALSSLQYLVILIPVSLMLAIMLALGRLYKDNEIAAMTGCGVGLSALYRPFFSLGLGLALLTAALAFQIGPWAGRTADYLARNAARFIQFNPFEPGRFKEVAGGRAVFYTAEMSGDGRELGTVFAQVQEPEGSSIVISRQGSQGVDPVSGDRDIRLRDGFRYLGQAGGAGWDVMHFDEFSTRVTPPDFIYISGKRRLMATVDLLGSDDPEDRAELAWRIAAPISVLILTLLAVPLAHIRPREGRYGKMVLGILAYLAYSQLLGLGQAWIAKGQVAPAVGLWWVHALMLSAALALIARRQQWWARARVRARAR
ncbi:MAG TPA: LPS export ABC transporter permease LptF [Solimonas sp.]|nr:LPS export ABC transporter permease LptF [Solimonas sp.]